MKILLDENMPVRLKKDFRSMHEALTVGDMGWLGIKNAALMNLIVINGFEILVITHRNPQYQQNLSKFSLNIVVLNVVINKYQDLFSLIGSPLSLLEKVPLDKVIVIK